MRKRLIVLLAVVAMSVAALAGPAVAGEVSGPPGDGGAQGAATPVAGFWSGDGAASICSFSGLNDEIVDDEPTMTQSYGTFLVLFMEIFDVKAQEAKELLEASPGHECNPNLAPWSNPKK